MSRVTWRAVIVVVVAATEEEEVVVEENRRGGGAVDVGACHMTLGMQTVWIM